MQKKQGSGLQVALWVFAIVAAIGVFAGFKFGWPMFLEHQADKELAKMPAYRQIAKWEPEAYAQMKREMIDSMQHHHTRAQAQGRVRGVVAGLAKKYMKTADDDVLVNYMKVTAEEIRQVASQNPDAAFEMVYSGKTDIDMTKYIDHETQKRDMDTLAEIIHSGVAKEAGVQDDYRATQLLKQVIAGMHNDYGRDADLAFNPKGPPPDNIRYDTVAAEAYAQRGPVDKHRSIEMMIEFYNRVLNLRSDQAAKVVRLLLSRA